MTHRTKPVDTPLVPRQELVQTVARLTSRATDTRALLVEVCDLIAAHNEGGVCAAWNQLHPRPPVCACAGPATKRALVQALLESRLDALNNAEPPPHAPAPPAPAFNAKLQRHLLILPLEWDGGVHGELWVALQPNTALTDPTWQDLREVGLLLACALERLHGASRLREAEMAANMLQTHMLNGVAHCRLVEERGTPVDFEYVQVNPAFSRLTGLHNVVGRRVSEVIPGIHRDNPEVLRNYAHVVRTGEPIRFEVNLQSLGLRLAVTGYRTTPGNFAAVFENLGALRTAEESLAREEHQLDALLQQLPLSVGLYDRQLNVVRVNEKFLTEAGLTRADVVGRNVYDVFPLMDEHWRGVHQRCLEGTAQRGERHQILDRSGGEAWIRWDVRPWRDSKGEIAGVISVSEDITARVKAEQAEKDSFQRVALGMASMDDLLFGLDLEGRFTDFHAPDQNSLWLAPEAFLGQTFQDVLPADVAGTLQKALETVRTTGKPYATDYSMSPADPDAEWWSAKVTARRAPSGEPVGYTVVSRNITDRKRAEARLQESEAQMRALLDVAPVGIAQARPSGEFVKVNLELCRITGFSEEELLGMTVQQLTHPQDRPGDAQLFAEIRSNRRGTYQREKRFLCKDGGYRWVNVHAVAIKDSAGNNLRSVATIEDITERREKESQERLLTTALHAAGLGIVITDPNANIQWVNPALCRMSGYEPVELLGKNTRMLGSGTMPREMYRELWQTILQGRVWSGEVVNRHKNGTLYPEDLSVTPVLDEQGTITNFIAIKRDATLRKATLEALHSTEEHYAALVNNVDEVIFTSDLEGRITLVNAAVSRFGFTAQEVTGTLARDYIHPDDLARVVDAWTTPGARRPVEFNILDASGVIRPVRATTRAVRVGGVLRGSTTFLVDLTHQREVEEQLRASQRMEAVGRLAGGVAHDFNNLLSVILSFTELAMADLRQQDPLFEDLGQVLSAARRAEGLTRQLLAFSRRQVLQPAVFGPTGLVEGMSKMLARLIGEDVELLTSLDAATWSIRADRGQLEQVLMNLVVNARDAMERGGTMTIATCNTTLDAHDAAALDVPPGDYVALSVQDTGSGMDKTTQDRLFEPFFTTKGPGKGTGLGLAMVYGIVKQSGGGIRVRSALGEGSTFTVYLPRSKLTTGEFPAAAVPAARTTRGETILVVEDEESLRNVARRVLVGAGYKVLLAANAGEALLLCERDGARVDLILTDVVMPGLSGPELVERVKGLCPRARVMFMSGYPQEHMGPQLVTPGPFLRKPYDAATLTAKVDEILGLGPDRSAASSPA